MTTLPNTLIMTFAKGGSLTRWSDLGRLDREKALLGGLLGLVPHIIFISEDGSRDVELAASLQDELGDRIHAITINQDDPELGPGRELYERVLARLGTSRRVVIQTMKLEDGGVSRKILGPLRRAGVQAALIARGGCIGSRVLAALCGPHSHHAVFAGSEEHDLCRRAQIVVGVSESMIDELCWRHGINPGRARLVPHFVAESDEPAFAEKRDTNLILAVGELDNARGVDIILRAIATQTPGIREKLRLEVIGDGTERETLRLTAGKLGVNAEFPGRLPHAEVIQRMRTCTVLVHASPQRRLSRSVVEAMAQGCPVIVADTPELNGIVESGATGIRVKPDPDAFAFAIASMLDDPDWREMIGSSAARVVHDRCGLRAVIERCRIVYSDALRIAPSAVSPRARRAG